MRDYANDYTRSDWHIKRHGFSGSINAPEIKTRKEIEEKLRGWTGRCRYDDGFREALRWVLGKEGSV